jgi:hypothetical protein
MSIQSVEYIVAQTNRHTVGLVSVMGRAITGSYIRADGLAGRLSLLPYSGGIGRWSPKPGQGLAEYLQIDATQTHSNLVGADLVGGYLVGSDQTTMLARQWGVFTLVSTCLLPFVLSLQEEARNTAAGDTTVVDVFSKASVSLNCWLPIEVEISSGVLCRCGGFELSERTAESSWLGYLEIVLMDEDGVQPQEVRLYRFGRLVGTFAPRSTT